MQQLILPHWARASQRCKCGHSSMEPLTSVGKVWNYRTASTFLSPKRTWNMHWFIYFFYFYRDKKHPQGCFFLFFFYHPACKSKRKNDQNHHREWQIYSEFLCWRFRRDHIWLAEVRGFLQSGQTAVVTPGRKRITNQILTVTLVYRCARGVTRRGRRQRFHSMFVGNVKNVWLENSAWQAIRWHTFFFFFLATVLLFCLHVSVCCCLRQLLEASLCTLWIMEVLGLYFSEPSSMVGGGVHTVEHKSS